MPVSLTVSVFCVCSFNVLRMGEILRKPKHFCMYSDVTILLAGSVELTRSAGGIRGVGRIKFLSRIDVSGGKSSARVGFSS